MGYVIDPVAYCAQMNAYLHSMSIAMKWNDLKWRSTNLNPDEDDVDLISLLAAVVDQVAAVAINVLELVLLLMMSLWSALITKMVDFLFRMSVYAAAVAEGANLSTLMMDDSVGVIQGVARSLNLVDWMSICLDYSDAVNLFHHDV